MTLLHLRDLAARQGLTQGVVTEVLDSRNRELLTTTSADDFIVSDQLISLLLAQISENAELTGSSPTCSMPMGPRSTCCRPATTS